MLQNASLVAKIGADIAENEPKFAKILEFFGHRGIAEVLSCVFSSTDSVRRLLDSRDRKDPGVVFATLS